MRAAGGLCVCASLALVVVETGGPRAEELVANPASHRVASAGRALYLEGRFRAAIAELQRALDTPGLTPGARAHIAMYIGLCHHALDRFAKAEVAFTRALRDDPGLRLSRDHFKPPIIEFFEAIRARLSASSRPTSRIKPRPRLDVATPPQSAHRLALTIGGGYNAGLRPLWHGGALLADLALRWPSPRLWPRAVLALALPTSQGSRTESIQRLQGVLRADLVWRFVATPAWWLQAAIGAGVLLSSARASELALQPGRVHAAPALALGVAAGLPLRPWLALRAELVAQAFPIVDRYVLTSSDASRRDVELGRSPTAELGLNLGLEFAFWKRPYSRR